MKVNDLNAYPYGLPPKTPPAGGVFLDPSFGSPVLRVTDETDSAGAHFVNGYSAIFDMFNVDSSRIIYLDLGGGGWTAQLDVVNRKLVPNSKRRLAKFSTNAPGYWSRKDPNILYVIECWQAANLWRYDFVADSWTLLADLSKLLPPMLPNTSWIGSRGMSWSENRFHIGTGTTAAPVNYIYDVALGKLLGPFTLAQALATGWAAGMDPATQAFLFAKSTMDTAGEVLWTADTQFVYDVVTGASFLPKFGVAGNIYGDVHADAGFRNAVISCGGVPNTGDQGVFPVLFTVDPANLSSYLSPRHVLGPRFLWGLDSHSSFRDKSGRWATFNLDGTIMGADVGKTPIFGDQEIFQFDVNSPADGSLNRRLAHSYSDPNAFTDAGMKYWASPHASQAQDNRAVGFNSTFGNKRIDLYVVFPDPEVVTGQLAGVTFTPDEAAALKRLADLFGAK